MNKNLSQELAKFAGKWVALSKDEQAIVASSESFQGVVTAAHVAGKTNLCFMKVRCPEAASK